MKVFDHIDFNKFFEDKIKFDPKKPRIEFVEPFEKVVLENIEELMLEMALGVIPGSGTSSAIRLDDDDIVYLYQFLPVDWSKALWWRYGPGLVSYARTRHQNIPEHDDDDSHFHGVGEKGEMLNDEKEESIVFSEKHLFGTGDQAQSHLASDPSLGHRGKGKTEGKLGWMKHDKFKEDKEHLGIGMEGNRKYTGIKFGWNKVYNKLNKQYKFAMQRVDDDNWKENGMLPQLSGYKPMNFKGVDHSLNRHFKAMAMNNHHPEGHHGDINTEYQDYTDPETGEAKKVPVHSLAPARRSDDPKEQQEFNNQHRSSLNWHQQNVLQQQYARQGFNAMGGITTNDTRSPHSIIPIGSHTSKDRSWSNGRPSAKNKSHSLGGEDYKKHLYDLMNDGLGKQYSDKSAEKTTQPFNLTASKKGPTSRYNPYEVFGLHKSMKQQNWELEKYFPMEMHQWAYDRMKEVVHKKSARIEGEEEKELAKRVSGINYPFQLVSGQKIQGGIVDPNWDDLMKKLELHKMHKVPVHNEEELKGIPKEDLEYINGIPYKVEENKFVIEAMGKSSLEKWQWVFLNRFVNRFDKKRTKNLTSPQHHGITSIYRSMPENQLNDTLDEHPELGFVHNALKHKQKNISIKDRQDREKEEKFMQDRQAKGANGWHKLGTHAKEKLPDGSYKDGGYVHHKPSKDEDLPHASHTDVMTGGVMHEFGGEHGNIKEFHNGVGEWMPIPQFKFFVPLLHRGQVLPSEKQNRKGLNIGAFGHSQVAEVETNHFGTDMAEDLHEVSKETAERYKGTEGGAKTSTEVLKEIEEQIALVEHQNNKKPTEEGKRQLEVLNKRYKEISEDQQESRQAGVAERYYVNKNDHFYHAATQGDIPSPEFYNQEKDDKHHDHNDTIRGTDHHHSQMEKFSRGENQESDKLVKYNTDTNYGFAKVGNKKKPFINCGIQDENGSPVLKSVHDGVQDAINSDQIKSNELLVAELTGMLGTLWGLGSQILKANVAHPQFFQNKSYEDHLEKEYKDLPRDIDNNLDLEEEHMGQSVQGTHETGEKFRRIRVKNYIISFSQRALSDDIPGKRRRGLLKEDHPKKRLAKTYHDDLEQSEIYKKRDVGQRRKENETQKEQADVQSSFWTKVNRFLKSQNAMKQTLAIKDAEGLMRDVREAKSAFDAMLTLWAISSNKVPQARQIAIDKFNVPEEVALSPDFPKEHGDIYNKALKLQWDEAWKWAGSKRESEWEERIGRSKGKDKDGNPEIYGGATEAINDENFVKTHIHKQVTKDVFGKTAEYDAHASRNIIRWNLVKSNVGENDHNNDKTVYSQSRRVIAHKLPDGLAEDRKTKEYTSNKAGEVDGAEEMDAFDVEIDDLAAYGKGKEEIAIDFMHAAYDYFLDSVNQGAIQNHEGDNFNDVKAKLIENGKKVAEMFSTSDYPSVQGLGEEFMRALAPRIGGLKPKELAVDADISSQIISSLNKSHENSHGGSRVRLAEFDDEVEKLKLNKKGASNNNKIANKIKEKDDYSKKLMAVRDDIKESNFSIEKLTEIVNGIEKGNKIAPKALEDAFIDEALDYLNHQHNFYENIGIVINAAKYLKGILGKDFLETFKAEVKHIQRRFEDAA